MALWLLGVGAAGAILGALWFGLWLLRHGFREFEQLERPVKKPVAFRCLFCGERKVDGPRGACWVCRVRRAASAWGRSR